MDIESAAPSPAPDTSSQQTINVAEQKAESQRKYNEHLSTIAPYLRSAFNEWLPQAQSTPISAFLVHYFGRQPEERELRSVEHLMNLRDGLSKTDKNGTDQAGGTVVQNQAPSGFQQQQATAFISESNGHAGQPKEAASSISKLLPGEAYERLACVGEGTYGKVYKARRVEDGVFVALKRIRMEGEKDGFPVTAMREIKLLQSLKQENIIRLHEMMVSKGES
jgi:CTD kinase subunit alpha